MSPAVPDSDAIDVKALMEGPAALIEPYMKQYVARMPLPANLIEAMDYSLLGPGKRLRPVLVIHACEAVAGDPQKALPAAAALEMIHCFSLIHDDLPAMDDDDLRRGRPTLHKKTNEAMAILAGDALMGFAFQLLISEVKPIELAAKLVSELADGTNAMIAGQVYDTLPDFDESVDPATRLKTIHSHKTGALIRASVRMGALSAGADEAQLAALTTFGDVIGLMFQVVDDLIDVTQTTEHLGKTAGKDADQDKLTYPAVFGVQETQAEVQRLRVEALSSLADLGPGAQPLRDLTEYLAVRTR